MQVPLDYYRILMLPIQADANSVETAYVRRRNQDLWPGYSSNTLVARQRLLQEARDILGDGDRRQSYDRQLNAANPYLEVDLDEIPAALAIQCENGDYEQALSGVQGVLRQADASSDLLLTQAIARLFLGREYWQKGEYEAAASMLQQALAELIHHHVFPEVQAEVISDLNKLRPYRILKLLSQQDLIADERQEGLQLLKDMLEERMGIEGTGQDGSELSSEDFLRFVQKARAQMTVVEQQELFEIEAKRPSVVATYLTVYALIARGYTENRPALIRRARGYLVRLAQRHDVNLEQAICALLLGQPEEATRLLERSHDEEAISQIRDAAGLGDNAGDTDILLGFCRYIENWLRTEVFPEYRDLDISNASLSTYFDNPQVQQYLEEMPASSSDTEWFTSQTDAVSLPSLPIDGSVAAPPYPAGATNGNSAVTNSQTQIGTSQNGHATNGHATANGHSSNGHGENGPRQHNGHGTTDYRTYVPSPSTSGSTTETTATASDMMDAGHYTSDLPGSKYARSSTSSPPSRTAARQYPAAEDNILDYPEGYDSYGPLDDDPIADKYDGELETLGPRRQSSGLLIRLGVVGVVLILLFFLIRAIGGMFSSGPSNDPEPQPLVDIDTPAITVEETPPEPPEVAVIDPGVLTESIAETTIRDWQDSKRLALGATYDVGRLDGVLQEPLLSQWRSRAQQLQASNAYYAYTLNGLTVEDVTASAEGEGSIVVEISEERDYILNGTRQPGSSSTDTYRVRYNLELGDDSQWRISSYDLL